MSRKRPIVINDDDDDNPLYGKRQAINYVLDALGTRLPSGVVAALSYSSGGGASSGGQGAKAKISSLKLADQYGIVIGSQVVSSGVTQQTLDKVADALVTQIKGQTQAADAAESQIGDAFRKRRLSDVKHGAQSALVQSAATHTHGPPIDFYEAYGLQPVVVNPAYDAKAPRSSLQKCLRFVSAANAKQAVLFHGSTLSCKEGLCKLFVDGNPSSLKSTIQAYGPGFYLTPFFDVALHYACDRAKARKETHGIVMEVVVSDIDKFNAMGEKGVPKDFGGDCNAYIVIRPHKIGHVSILRVHEFDRDAGRWCPKTAGS